MPVVVETMEGIGRIRTGVISGSPGLSAEPASGSSKSVKDADAGEAYLDDNPNFLVIDL